jgi:hypothetical protein
MAGTTRGATPQRRVQKALAKADCTSLRRAKPKSINIPPDPDDLNEWRAELVRGALATFKGEIRPCGLETLISDFLCDLAHLCDYEGISLPERLCAAADFYLEATNFRGKQLSDDDC